MSQNIKMMKTLNYVHRNRYLVFYYKIKYFFTTSLPGLEKIKAMNFLYLHILQLNTQWQEKSLPPPAGSKVILDSAVDPDQGANGRVKSYSIESGDWARVFRQPPGKAATLTQSCAKDNSSTVPHRIRTEAKDCRNSSIVANWLQRWSSGNKL